MSIKTIQKALGRKIRDLRKSQGHSQEAFADLCGVHRTFMGIIERGETNISLMNIVRVASVLGITLAQLMLDVEEKAETED